MWAIYSGMSSHILVARQLQPRRIVPFFAPLRKMSTKPDSEAKFLARPKELAIISAASGIGQLKPGVENAPMKLMASRLPTILHEVCGFGPIKPPGDAYRALHSNAYYAESADQKVLQMSNMFESISQHTHANAMDGRMVLTLGGDHSIAIGSVSGIAKAVFDHYQGQKDLGVIWVDAHADINTPATSNSGNLHGMPLGFLSGLADIGGLGEFAWLTSEHHIKLSKLVYIGLRDVDMSEAKVIEMFNIKVFKPDDIERIGIETVMDKALEHLGTDTPIHLSFDIDGLDPGVAPSTGFPVSGGLSLEEGLYVSERLSRSGQLISMDLVEFNPELGSANDSEKTRDAAVQVIARALGEAARSEDE